MTLISASELAALQDLAQSGMVTTVSVYSQTIEKTDDGQKTTYPASPSFTVQGWLYNQTGPGGTIGVLDGGGGISQQIRLMVPVGTVIVSGDKVVVDGEAFYCQFTSNDDTYPTSLKCYLRVIE